MPKRKTDEIQESPPRVAPPMPFVGQARVLDYFARIGPNGLAHAYLLHGPRGVGKTTFARSLALTLHCERPTSFPTGYCGQCATCRRGIAGSSGDTILANEDFIAALDPKGERKILGVNIDVAHEIIRLMQLRSYEGGRLVCIVPNFDSITYDYVYNTFLKELEEPDPGKLFLLTSQRAERILPTIRSRSVMVRFDPLPEHEIADALSRQYGEKPVRAAALARRAQGSLGDALELRSDESAALRDAARRWALSCLSHPSVLPPMPTLGKEDARASLDAVLRDARLAIRDLMVFAVAGKDAVFDIESVAEYQRACASIGPDAAQKAMKALALFDEAGRIAATNVPPASAFGWLQVQLRSLGR
jgi:DNA polymerase III delta prime subunit